MSETRLENWTTFLIIALVALSCYWLKKSHSVQSLEVETQDFSYEMPRPSSYSADFDLSGRRIIRKVEVIGGAKKALPAVAGKVPATPAANTAKADAKKKAEEAAKKAAQARKNQSSVRIVEAQTGSTMTRIADSSLNAGPIAAPAYANTQTPATTANPAADDGVEKMSASQWQSLLMAQPTAANGNLFLTAFRKKAVDSATFYQITTQLFTSSAKDRETLGLSLLQQTPSVQSFTILVTDTNQVQDTSLKAQANKVITSYSSPSEFIVLAQALYSTNAQVLGVATQLIATALSTESAQGGTGGSSATPQQFQIFIPGLRQLASSSDPAVASEAQALLNSIMTMTHASV